VSFVREAEAGLARMLAEIGAPHAEMVRQAQDDYGQVLAGGEGAAEPMVPEAATRVDLDALRRELKLQLPTAQATLDYSLQMKSEALLHLGVDRFVHWMQGLLRRAGKPTDSDPKPGGTKGQRALKAALKRMRREMAASIRSHLMNHRENIKYQYLLKLADAAGEALYHQLTAHCGMHLADLAALDDKTRAADPRRTDLTRQLAALAQSVQSLGERLNDHRADLEALGRSYETQI
jgi:hypothetical protein